ncbi:MAG: hypothetical protein QOF78_1180, partial [Phycisphaerales bacterium]|nr:hypothetical protein [Phycisphaerales bacterium]
FLRFRSARDEFRVRIGGIERVKAVKGRLESCV